MGAASAQRDAGERSAVADFSEFLANFVEEARPNDQSGLVQPGDDSLELGFSYPPGEHSRETASLFHLSLAHGSLRRAALLLAPAPRGTSLSNTSTPPRRYRLALARGSRFSRPRLPCPPKPTATAGEREQKIVFANALVYARTRT